MEYTVVDPQGNEHVLEGPEGASDQEVLAKAQELLGPSKLESFGRGALSNFPLGQQATAALEEGPYSQNLADLKAKAAESKAANPISYGAGAVTGTLAPLAIPGVGPALKAAPVAGNALLGAANAVSDTDVTQEPEEALKQGLKGAVIGGATAGLLGKILPTGAGMAAKAETEAVKTAGLRPSALGGMTEEELQKIGQFMHQNDLVAGPLSERVAKAQALTEQFGKQIGDMGAGKTAGVPVDTAPLHEAAQRYANSTNREARALTRDYISGINDVQALGKNPTFDQLQNLKEMYGKLAFNPDHTVKNAANADVYFQLKDAIQKTISASPAEYQEVLSNYSLSKDIEQGLTKQHGIHVSTGESHAGVGGHGLHSLIKQIPGVTNPNVAIPGGAAIAAAGHPVLGAVLGIHSLMATPQARSQTAAAAAKAIPAVGTGIKMLTTGAVTSHLLNRLNTNPQSLGRYAQPLMKAAQEGGSQGLAATHYILSQTHPEYNQMMMNEESSNEP